MNSSIMKKFLRNINGSILFLISYFIIFSPFTIMAQDVEVYKDKNGYFEFVPPRDWTRKDFLSDPRSKVHFQSPDGAATIGIIVRPDEGETYDDLLARQKENTEKHKLRFAGGKFGLGETIFCGFKAVKIEIDLPGAVKQELYFFLANGLHFNLTYGAENNSDLSKYRSEALKALSSVKPLGEAAKATQ